MGGLQIFRTNRIFLVLGYDELGDLSRALIGRGDVYEGGLPDLARTFEVPRFVHGPQLYSGEGPWKQLRRKAAKRGLQAGR
jgi:hypothetical protein